MKFTRIVTAGAALALSFAAPAARAQTFATPDPNLERIWRLGMTDSSRVQWLAQRLLDSIGPRLTATPGMERAQDWLVKMYTSWGIDAKKEQYGTWRAWRRGTSHIDLISPRVRTLEGTMLGYSPGTGGKDVEAVPIILPKFNDTTGAEFRTWLKSGAAKGKLVMISAPNPSCRTNAEWDEFGAPESIARIRAERAALTADMAARIRATKLGVALGGGALGWALDSAGVAGVISYRPKDSRGAMEVFETHNKVSPNIALSCEDYGLVYRLTENNMGPKLRLRLDGELMGEKPVFNVIGRIQGTTKPDEYVMLSAHFDSWDGASGATDNGTGSLTMLEAMRILKMVVPRPQRTILVGHWSSEENGLNGSRSWAAMNQPIVSKMQGLFNQDNGTGRIRNLGGSGWPDANNKMLAWYDRLPKEFQEQAPFYGSENPVRPGFGQPGGGSDNASFACYGAPTFGLGATPWDYSNYTWHTDKDTYDKVVFDDLRKNATLTAMLAYMAAQEDTPVRRDTTIATMHRTPPPSSAAPAGGGRGGRGGGGGGGGGRGGAGRGGQGEQRVLTIADCPPGDRVTKYR